MERGRRRIALGHIGFQTLGSPRRSHRRCLHFRPIRTSRRLRHSMRHLWGRKSSQHTLCPHRGIALQYRRMRLRKHLRSRLVCSTLRHYLGCTLCRCRSDQNRDVVRWIERRLLEFWRSNLRILPLRSRRRLSSWWPRTWSLLPGTRHPRCRTHPRGGHGTSCPGSMHPLHRRSHRRCRYSAVLRLTRRPHRDRLYRRTRQMRPSRRYRLLR